MDPTTGKPPYEEEPDDLQQMMEEDPYERAEEKKRQAQKAGPRSIYDTPEYREYVQRGTEIKQAMEDVPGTMSFITSAPEGYFYQGQDVQEYNAKVREYNQKVREYKRKLIDAYQEYQAGLITYDSYEVQRKSYEAQLKLYEAEMKRTAPQREAFLEYLESIGPPEPTEEQRRRMEAGMPITGIPGPANVPPSGSLGEWVQPIMQKAAEQTLGIMEAPFKALTDPFRNAAVELGDKSIEAAMEAKPWTGFGYYAAGTALDIGAMGIDIATWEFRPGLWVDVSRTLTGLAVSPEARTAVADEALRDPFGFTAEMVGGAYLGGQLKKLPGKAYGEGKLAYKTLKAQRGGTSEGLYGVSIKEPTWSEALGEWRAIKDVKYRETYAAKATDIAEFKFLEEAGITEFPEATIVQRTEFLGFEEVKDAALVDTTSNLKFDSLPDSIDMVSTDVAPYQPPKGKWASGIYDKKLWRSTGEGLEQIYWVPEKTPLMPIYKPIPGVEIAPSWTPGIRYKWIDPIKASKPHLKLLDIGKASVLSLSKVKSIDKVFTAPTVSLKQIEKPIQDILQKPKLVELPKMKQPQITGLTQTQIQTPTQTPIEKLKLEQIQIPILSMPQITMPKMSIPEEPTPIYPPDFPYFEPPETPRRPIVKGDLLFPKKKKGKKGRKGVFELRVDFKEPRLLDIADITFKEPKILGFGTEKKGKKKKKGKRKRS